jgi:hypothetical protein
MKIINFLVKSTLFFGVYAVASASSFDGHEAPVSFADASVSFTNDSTASSANNNATPPLTDFSGSSLSDGTLSRDSIASAIHIADDVAHVGHDINIASNWARPYTINAINEYEVAAFKLADVFATCENYWRAKSGFIEDPLTSDRKSVAQMRGHNLFCVKERIEDLNEILGILLTAVKSEKYLGTLSAAKRREIKEKIDMKLAIHVENNDSKDIVSDIAFSVGHHHFGMRALGMSFSKVTKPEWKGQNALQRYNDVMGDFTIHMSHVLGYQDSAINNVKGELQNAIDKVLETLSSAN